MIPSIYALVVTGALALVACALGLLLLEAFSRLRLGLLEKASFCLALGCGLLAYGVLFLGFAGALNLWSLLGWLILGCAVAWREILRIARFVWRLPSLLVVAWKRARGAEKVFLGAAGALLIATALQALTPPWDYDGLMYHLQGPQLYLEASRLIALPNLWGAMGPSTLEMLYTTAMALGTDRAPKLLHLAFGVCLVVTTFALGRRLLPKRGEWIAAAVLLGTPILPVWASLAYSDLAWATFESLSLLAIVSWVQGRDRRWLVLGGLCMGLALGSKYLALGGMAAIALCIGVFAMQGGRKEAFADVGSFALVALAVGSPWYVKNWIWTGNPVFPTYFGGGGWSSERVAALMSYLGSFGTGGSIRNYLLLPFNLYLQHARFATFQGSIEIPGLLFPFALASPLLTPRKPLILLWLSVPLRFVFWAVGSQQTRFLLPLFPAASVLAAAGLLGLCKYLADPSLRRALMRGVVGGAFATTLAYAVAYWLVVRPGQVLVGTETPQAFLTRMVPDYSAIQYVKANLPAQDRVLMMWDGEGYYCDARCLPDAEQSRWTLIVGSQPSAGAVTGTLRTQGVTHLLFSVADAGFVLQHDPTGANGKALDFFLDAYRNECTRPVFSGKSVALYELTCP